MLAAALQRDLLDQAFWIAPRSCSCCHIPHHHWYWVPNTCWKLSRISLKAWFPAWIWTEISLPTCLHVFRFRTLTKSLQNLQCLTVHAHSPLAVDLTCNPYGIRGNLSEIVNSKIKTNERPKQMLSGSPGVIKGVKRKTRNRNTTEHHLSFQCICYKINVLPLKALTHMWMENIILHEELI